MVRPSTKSKVVASTSACTCFSASARSWRLSYSPLILMRRSVALMNTFPSASVEPPISMMPVADDIQSRSLGAPSLTVNPSELT